jgi:deoxyguanosine kinase
MQSGWNRGWPLGDAQTVTEAQTHLAGGGPAGMPRRVVVEGPIGVGKTSLARRLAASFNYAFFPELPAANPFLQRYYGNPGAHALKTQLHFFLQRREQARWLGLGEQTDLAQVSDFMFEKDALFAEVTLDADELLLYRRIAAELVIESPSADLVIYLQAPVDVLMARIRRRGIGYEQGISAAYLRRLSTAYVEFFHAYDASSLLIVNAGAIDLTESGGVYLELLEQIRTPPGGRYYFNPGPKR